MQSTASITMVLTRDQIFEIDKKVRKNWTPENEPTGVDIWRSHFGEDRPWSDDCDGLTHSVLHALIAAGAELSQIYRVVIKFEGEKIAHMFGCVQLDTQTFYCVGDTLRSPYNAKNIDKDYMPFVNNRMDEAKLDNVVWCEGFPWKIVKGN